MGLFLKIYLNLNSNFNCIACFVAKVNVKFKSLLSFDGITSQNCPFSSTFCRRGSEGPGGCVGFGNKCMDGRICPFSSTFCRRGSEGPGGCVGFGNKCMDGRICPFSSTFCRRGSEGPGGCVGFGYRCIRHDQKWQKISGEIIDKWWLIYRFRSNIRLKNIHFGKIVASSQKQIARRCFTTARLACGGGLLGGHL
ncbi:hypothetical protein BpHYR1_039582 [Brachionus plicatilis]|uniref:Uncharacterized protein n=1 Tax=Brachionus plicatilis TaxID=10195 RepID=A0A3M7QMR7_BRAPC|nr:hypothetical protein BpHYR1_039582 [Brachionus plicatilis]